MTTRIMPRVLTIAAMVLGSSCAKPDWIQQTLVTVDVTGTWANSNGNVTLKLAQEGAKVSGSMNIRGAAVFGNISGAIEGTVSGDVFRFKQTSGTPWLQESEMTVSGDEMSGRLNAPVFSSVVTTLRRVDSSRPTSQP